MHDDSKLFSVQAQALVNNKWKRRDLTVAPCGGCSATLLVMSKKCKKCYNKSQATPATCHSAQHHRKHHITTLYAVDTFGNNDRQHSRTLAIVYNNDIATCSAHIPPHDMHAELVSHLPPNVDTIHVYLTARDRDTLASQLRTQHESISCYTMRLQYAPPYTPMADYVDCTVRLHITEHSITILYAAVTPPERCEVLGVWHMRHVRRYGLVDRSSICVEVGRGSRQCGSFIFYTPAAPDIELAFEQAVYSRLSEKLKIGSLSQSLCTPSPFPMPDTAHSENWLSRPRSGAYDNMRIEKPVNTTTSVPMLCADITKSNLAWRRRKARALAKESKEYIKRSARRPAYNPLACKCGYPDKIGVHVDVTDSITYCQLGVKRQSAPAYHGQQNTTKSDSKCGAGDSVNEEEAGTFPSVPAADGEWRNSAPSTLMSADSWHRPVPITSAIYVDNSDCTLAQLKSSLHTRDARIRSQCAAAVAQQPLVTRTSLSAISDRTPLLPTTSSGDMPTLNEVMARHRRRQDTIAQDATTTVNYTDLMPMTKAPSRKNTITYDAEMAHTASGRHMSSLTQYAEISANRTINIERVASQRRTRAVTRLTRIMNTLRKPFRLLDFLNH